jgi:hypothetical protein
MITCQSFVGMQIYVCAPYISASRVNQNIVFEYSRLFFGFPIFFVCLLKIIVIQMLFENVFAVDYIYMIGFNGVMR